MKSYLEDEVNKAALTDIITDKLEIPNVSPEMEEAYVKTQLDLLSMILMDFIEDI